jgi:hypothetical protein
MQTHQLWNQIRSSGGSARPESRLPTLQEPHRTVPERAGTEPILTVGWASKRAAALDNCWPLRHTFLTETDSH